jgi:16S rRNA (adenine1518-N6/adenine1519-N6)-dimethyltransferase
MAGGSMTDNSPRTKKSLGQHWLYDDASLDAMVASADVGPEDTVLEVGPGPGALTAKLVQRAKLVVAVEFDQALARALCANVDKLLQDGLSATDKLHVVREDILRFDLTTLPPAYKVVANIPYYLTSNLLRVLCENANPFSKAALLIQKEVAERVCARPGNMSLLSVSVQFYCEASLGEAVPAELFTPPPKVDSQILKLTYHQAPLFADVDTKTFFRIVKAGFSQRRKTLLNSLGAGLHLSREQTVQLLSQADIAPSIRAQNLSLDEWYALYKAYAL